MKDGTLAVIEKDVIGAKYLKEEKSLCLVENAIFIVEVPVLEHNQPEGKEAKTSEKKPSKITSLSRK